MTLTDQRGAATPLEEETSLSFSGLRVIESEALQIIKVEQMSGASLHQAHWIAKIYADLNEKGMAFSWPGTFAVEKFGRQQI